MASEERNDWSGSMEATVQQLLVALSETSSQLLSEARIKIDVGLSLDAPHSVEWLKQDPDLIVFGFEPLPLCLDSVETMFQATSEMRRLRRRIVIVPVALGVESMRTRFFECDDPGVSSFHRPREFSIKNVLEIDSLRLEDFLYEIENQLNQKFGFFQHLKTDCQGADIKVLQGAEKYLERVAVITCEADSHDYIDSVSNDVRSIREFLGARGFVQYNQKPRWKEILGPKIQRSMLHTLVLTVLRKRNRKKDLEAQSGSSTIKVSDPTFINQRFSQLVEMGEFEVFQTH